MRKRSKLSEAGDRGPRNQSCLTGSLPERANSAVEREGQGEALGMWASGARSGPKFPPEASPRLLSSGLAWALALGPGACTMWRKMGGPDVHRPSKAKSTPFRAVWGHRDLSGKRQSPERVEKLSSPRRGRMSTARPTPRRPQVTSEAGQGALGDAPWERSSTLRPVPLRIRPVQDASPLFPAFIALAPPLVPRTSSRVARGAVRTGERPAQVQAPRDATFWAAQTPHVFGSGPGGSGAGERGCHPALPLASAPSAAPRRGGEAPGT